MVRKNKTLTNKKFLKLLNKKKQNTISKRKATNEFSEIISNARTKTGNRWNNYLKEFNEAQTQFKS